MQQNMQLNVTMTGVDGVSGKVKGVIDKIGALTSKAQQAKQRLKEIGITQNQINGFSELKSKTDAAKAALEAARQKATALGKAVSIGEATKKDFDKARKAVQDLEAQYGSLLEKTNKSRSALAAKGVETTKLASKTRQLREEVDRLNKMTERQAKIDQARARADQMRSRAGSMAIGGAAAIGAGAGVLGGVGSTVRAYADAESAATQLKSVMMDANGTVGVGFTKVNALATELGNKLPGTTVDFQQMMITLKEMGTSDAAILGGLAKSSAYLAVALKMPYDEAARFSAKVGEAAGVAENDMMSFLDVVARTKNIGVAVDEMGYAYGRSAGKLKELGLQGLGSAQQLAPLYAIWTKGGLSGETVGTGFASILSNMQVYTYGLSKGALSAKQTLSGAGVTMDFLDGNGKFKGVENMISQLEKLKQLKPGQQASVIRDIFGTGQDAQMVSSIINKGLAGYQEMLGRMSSQASLETKVNSQLGTLAALWEAADGTWTNVKATMGETLSPELKSLTTWLGETSAKMQQWATENPKAAKTLMLIAVIIGTLLVVLGAAAVVIGGFLVGMAAMAVAGAVVGVGMLPLLLILGGIALAIAAVVALFVYWGDITSYVSGKWNEFTTWLGGLKDQFVSYGTEMINGLVDGITSGFSSAWETVKGLLGGLVTNVKDFLGIKSPSRVFAEIGGFTAAGLAMGMAHGTPAVVSTAENMARQVSAVGVPGVGAGGGAGAGAAGGFSIGQVTIVIDGASGDPAAIAKAVEDQLRKMASRSRSDAAARFYED